MTQFASPAELREAAEATETEEGKKGWAAVVSHDSPRYENLPLSIVPKAKSESRNSKRKAMFVSVISLSAGLIIVLAVVFLINNWGFTPFAGLIPAWSGSEPEPDASDVLSPITGGESESDFPAPEDESDSELSESSSLQDKPGSNSSGSSSAKPDSGPSKPNQPDSNSDPGGVSLVLRGKSMASQELASMVNSGEIPRNINDLDLGDNALRDLTPLSTLTGLTTLDLSVNFITDLSPLQSLTKLTKLELSSNAISDITSLKSLTNLTELGLSGNIIGDISPLKVLTGLRTLGIPANSAGDIDTLKSLGSLRTLYIFRSSELQPEQKSSLQTALPHCTIHFYS
jgi:hypothetical protein